MEKWEYRHEYIALLEDNLDELLPREVQKATSKTYVWQEALEKQLNSLGEQGWELVSISDYLREGEGRDGYALFKRKIVVNWSKEA